MSILVERRARVTWITLNRPSAMNALTPEMHQELEAAFDDFAADPAQFICVITGAGERAFCAGSDLRAGFGGTYPPHGYAGLIERFDLTKPVIAAVNGFALGGGFEIALAADLIIAADTASFGLPEPLVGAVALGGGIHRLVRQIGLKRAMGYLFTSRRMSASEAFTLGLVNEVVPPAELTAAVARWCAEILAGAPLSVRATKEAALRGLDEPSLEAAIKAQTDYPAWTAWRHAEDTSEGPRAFAEKRKPVWQGR
jgi:crotonobetainyl-CoA hydratase